MQAQSKSKGKGREGKGKKAKESSEPGFFFGLNYFSKWLNSCFSSRQV
jgi:hypothetical protein